MLFLIFKAKQTNYTSQYSGDSRQSGKRAKIRAAVLRMSNLCFSAKICQTHSIFALKKSEHFAIKWPGKCC